MIRTNVIYKWNFGVRADDWILTPFREVDDGKTILQRIQERLRLKLRMY
jgi:hypothetical protein